MLEDTGELNNAEDMKKATLWNRCIELDYSHEEINIDYNDGLEAKETTEEGTIDNEKEGEYSDLVQFHLWPLNMSCKAFPCLKVLMFLYV